MSVIGRLDEQVNDILISPLEKERRRKRDAEPEAPEDEQRASTQRALIIPQPQDRASNSEYKSPERDSSRRDELPVWML